VGWVGHCNHVGYHVSVAIDAAKLQDWGDLCTALRRNVREVLVATLLKMGVITASNGDNCVMTFTKSFICSVSMDTSQVPHFTSKSKSTLTQSRQLPIQSRMTYPARDSHDL
jgi:hypothetical protein